MKNLKLTNENVNRNSTKSENTAKQSGVFKSSRKICAKRIIAAVICAVMLIIGLSGCGFTDDRVDVPVNGSDYVTITNSDVGNIELYPLGFYDRVNDRITSTAQFTVELKLNIQNLRTLTKSPISGNLLYINVELGFSDGTKCNAFFECLDFSLTVYDKQTPDAEVTLNRENTKSVQVADALFKYEATQTAVDGYRFYVSSDVCASDAEFVVFEITYTMAPTADEYRAIYTEVGNGVFSNLKIEANVTDYKPF